MKVGPLWLKLQVACGDALAMGPGKADLLDAIVRHGSISAAARALGMSYRRAWLLVDEMNRCFEPPLVETSVAAGPSAARVSARRGAPSSQPIAKWSATRRQSPMRTPMPRLRTTEHKPL